jgi:hypothetical protein
MGILGKCRSVLVPLGTGLIIDANERQGKEVRIRSQYRDHAGGASVAVLVMPSRINSGRTRAAKSRRGRWPCRCTCSICRASVKPAIFNREAENKKGREAGSHFILPCQKLAPHPTPPSAAPKSARQSSTHLHPAPTRHRPRILQSSHPADFHPLRRPLSKKIRPHPAFVIDRGKGIYLLNKRGGTNDDRIHGDY